MKKIIGYQIVSDDGKGEYPQCFYSFEVFTDIVQVTAWISFFYNNDPESFRWVILPVFEGEIEEPTLVDTLDLDIYQ